MTVENKRVYEVAKELGKSNKEIIECLENKLGVMGKSHSSTLSASQVSRLKDALKPSGNAVDAKKPKAFVVKKAKVEHKESETVSSDSSSNIAPVPSPSIPNRIENEKPATSVNRPNSSTPDMRSLLEYNNRNSQKRREEEFRANRAKRQESDQRPQRPDGTNVRPAGANTRPAGQGFNRNNQAGRPSQPPTQRPTYHPDRRNVIVPRGPQRPPRPQDSQKPAPQGQDRPQDPNKQPVKRHIISQEIYDSKSPAKKKVVKGKEKQYKSKEELQELISLEKAISQKHKKKSKTSEEDIAITKVVLNQVLTVGELADKIKKSPAEIVRFLMMQGVLATVNQVIDVKTQKQVCESFEIETADEDVEAFIQEEIAKEEKAKIISETDQKLLKLRAPVVSIMGHVDHGKTTLLDSIRASKHKIVSTEVGGITQSIGAYTVYLEDNNDKKIVFIDTPGHEAFTEMRARGAKATDIAILVVAADDGIMPQTIEAINHAKAAEVPILVAVNKMDKPGANPDKIMQQLTEHGLVPEEWGGETICVKVSALQGAGIDELLEYILLMAEMQNLKANPSAKATGVVIEANLDKGKGPVATLLVQNGTLSTGDCCVVGTVAGKVRALLSDSGERVKKAGPSTPVEILGLTDVPQAGDFFEVVENEKAMKSIAQGRKDKERNSRLEAMMPSHVRNEVVGSSEDEIQKLNLIIKANTHGSAEAVSQAVGQLESKEILTKIVHVGVGDISEADVMLASASNAIILGFTVKEDSNAQLAAEKHGVNIKKYNIIYQVLEDLEQTMLSLLQPEIKEVNLGQAEVRQVFTVGKTSRIAGCYVTEGKIVRNKTAVLIRNGVEIFKGQIDQLKRFKDDAKEVAQGFECGISFAKFNDIQEGDIIKVTTTEEVERQVLV